MDHKVFECDWAGEATVSVADDGDGYVEILTHSGSLGDPQAAVYMRPSRARDLAREITLTSFSVEGECPLQTSELEADSEPTRDRLDRVEVFALARELAGPDASIAHVLMVANYLGA